MKMDKKLSASGGFAPLAPTRDSAPVPRWGLRPRAPFIGSRSALAMVRPLGKSCIRPWMVGSENDLWSIYCLQNASGHRPSFVWIIIHTMSSSLTMHSTECFTCGFGIVLVQSYKLLVVCSPLQTCGPVPTGGLWPMFYWDRQRI